MKKPFVLLASLLLTVACNQNPNSAAETENTNATEVDTDAGATTDSLSFEARVDALKEKGHKTFVDNFEGQQYLMQEYYIVFLKAGENRSQDSLETARLMEQHLAHLTRMAEEGYSSLTGPMGDDGEIRGIVVYNTPTMEEADSLARLDPMVQAGRLEVEVHPWWTESGGRLK